MLIPKGVQALVRNRNNRRRRVVDGYADPDEVASWAHDLSDAFLLCREIGHNWRPWAAQWVPHEQCYERVLRCTRCRTERQQVLSNRGAIVTSGYAYPDGYQIQGMGRITGEGRDSLRLESLVRIVGEQAEIEE